MNFNLNDASDSLLENIALQQFLDETSYYTTTTTTYIVMQNFKLTSDGFAIDKWEAQSCDAILLLKSYL